MEEVKRLLLDLIEHNNSVIESYRQKDYELMIRSVEKLKQDDYSEESLSQVFSFDFIKKNYSNIDVLIKKRNGYKELIDLFSSDFVNISTSKYHEILTKYQLDISLTPLNLQTLQKMYQNDQITISKQPIVNQINKIISSINQKYQDAKNDIENYIENLHHILDQKRYDYNGRNNIALELDMLRSKQEQLSNLLTILNDKGLFENYDQYRKVVLLIESSGHSEKIKQQLLIDMFDAHQKQMLQPLKREINVVNEEIEENADELFNNVEEKITPVLDSEVVDINKNKNISFSDIVSDETIDSYKFYKLSIDDRKSFDLLKNYIEIYIDQNGLTKQDISEPFILEYVNMINETSNGREEYYDGTDINWQLIIADLYKNSNNEDEVLKICEFTLKAISEQKHMEKIKATYNFRSKQLLNIQKELQTYNNEVMKLDHSQAREDLVVKINVILSQLHELDVSNEEEYNTLIGNYESMKIDYQKLLNPSFKKEKSINNDDNILIFSNNFVDEIKNYPDISYYREIKHLIETLKSKEKMESIKNNYNRYRRSDKKINGVSEVKGNDLMIMHIKIDEGCYYVFGITKREYDRRLQENYYVTDEELNAINKWLEQNDKQEIISYCDNQLVEVMKELSKWEKGKGVK